MRVSQSSSKSEFCCHRRLELSVVPMVQQLEENNYIV